MKLIVGLGNPGERYKDNRHNVGYMLVSVLGKKPLKKVVVRKTNEFMNDSGRAVRKLMDEYGVGEEGLFVAYDDLDIALGSYKITKGKGPKDHKGVNSINEEIGENYWHIRIGVENRDPNNRVLGEEYVLQDFSDEERQIIDTVLRQIKHESRLF